MRLLLRFCASCAFLRPSLLVLFAAFAGHLAAQPANVQADPTTGALFRPAAATFISGNSLLTTSAAAAAYQPLDADLTSWAAVVRAGGFDTFVATPSSANLASLVTGQTGTGALVFGTSPTFTTPTLGAATATSITGATDLTLAGGSTGASLVLGQGASGNVSLRPTNGIVKVTEGAGATSILQIPVAFGNAYLIGGNLNGGADAKYSYAAFQAQTMQIGRVNDAFSSFTETARFSNTGNLLIGGTTDTSSRLKIVGTDSSGPKTWTASSAALSGALFDSYQDSGGNGFQRYTDIVSLQDSDGVNGGGVIRFVTNSISSDSGVEAMRVTKAQNLLIGGTTDITGSGGLKVFGTTAASSTTTGALQVAGGVGVAGAGYFGGNVTVGTGAAAVSSVLNRGTTAQSSLAQWQTASAANWSVGSGATGTNTNLEFYNHNTASSNLTLNYTTGAATFAGAVSTATSLTAQTASITGTNSAASYPLIVKNNALKASASQYTGILVQTADASSVDLGLLYFTAVSASDRNWRLGAFDNGGGGWSKGTFPGVISITDTTASTGVGTGALQVAGGIYAGAASVFGGTSLSGINGSGSFDFIASRATTSAGATVQYKTAATLNWFHGTRGLANNNWYLFNNSTSANTLTFDYATDAATFAGAVTLSAGALTATSTAATQGIFKGWNSRSGANADNGQIDVGGATGLRLMSDASGTGGSVIDDRWDNAASSLTFRLRGNGTPVTSLTLNSTAATFAGAVTIAGTVIHTLSATPASASAAGTVGTMSWDANYIYICTATNTWKRVAIATW